MVVMVWRSVVEEVTWAQRFFLESVSTMILFLLICSWISSTFSTPRTTK